MKARGKKKFYYDDRFKLQVVEESIKGDVSKYSIWKKYGISSGTLYQWIRTFAPGYSSKDIMEESRRRRIEESEEVRLLKQALRAKELELSRSKMETAIYRELVAIAKEDFGLDLLKKGGTKQ